MISQHHKNILLKMSALQSFYELDYLPQAAEGSEDLKAREMLISKKPIGLLSAIDDLLDFSIPAEDLQAFKQALRVNKREPRSRLDAFTVEDLATHPLFHAAFNVVMRTLHCARGDRLERDCWERIKSLLREECKGLSVESLYASPIHVLRAFERYEAWLPYFERLGIATVFELACWTPFHHARAIFEELGAINTSYDTNLRLRPKRAEGAAAAAVTMEDESLLDIPLGIPAQRTYQAECHPSVGAGFKFEFELGIATDERVLNGLGDEGVWSQAFLKLLGLKAQVDHLRKAGSGMERGEAETYTQQISLFASTICKALTEEAEKQKTDRNVLTKLQKHHRNDLLQEFTDLLLHNKEARARLLEQGGDAAHELENLITQFQQRHHAYLLFMQDLRNKYYREICQTGMLATEQPEAQLNIKRQALLNYLAQPHRLFDPITTQLQQGQPLFDQATRESFSQQMQIFLEQQAEVRESVLQFIASGKAHLIFKKGCKLVVAGKLNTPKLSALLVQCVHEQACCIWETNHQDQNLTILAESKPGCSCDGSTLHVLYDSAGALLPLRVRPGAAVSETAASQPSLSSVESAAASAAMSSAQGRQDIPHVTTVPGTMAAAEATHSSVPRVELFLVPHDVTANNIELWLTIFSPNPGDLKLLVGSKMTLTVTGEPEVAGAAGELLRREEFLLRPDIFLSFVIRQRISVNDLAENRCCHFKLDIRSFLGETLHCTASASTLPTSLAVILKGTSGQPFSVLLGSCYHFKDDENGRLDLRYSELYAPGKYNQNNPRPNIKFHVGDQVYMDIPVSYAMHSFHSHTNIEQTFSLERYLPSWRGRRWMLEHGGNFFAPDDHEIYNDSPDNRGHRHLLGLSLDEDFRRQWEALAKQLLSAIQTERLAVQIFNIGEDLSFCMVDTRSTRESRTRKLRFLIDHQFDRLRDWIRNLRSPGILAIPQPLLVNHRNLFETILDEIFDFLRDLIRTLERVAENIREFLQDHWWLGIIDPVRYAVLWLSVLIIEAVLDILYGVLVALEEGLNRLIARLRAPGSSDDDLVEYERQYNELARLIAQAQHDIVVLTGDKHFARLAQVLLNDGKHSLIEIMSSPLANISGSDIEESNAHSSWQLNPPTARYVVNLPNIPGLPGEIEIEVPLTDGPQTSPAFFPQTFVPGDERNKITYLADAPFTQGNMKKTQRNFALVSFWKESQDQRTVAMRVRLHLPDQEGGNAVRWEEHEFSLS